MSTKHDSAYLGKAEDDEPIFVLLGRDICAPEAIEAWVDVAISRGLHDDKIADAMQVADAMAAWRARHARAVEP
jgi:hypothetical protein